jgi:hypothetical protein
VPESGLQISADGRSATLEIKDLTVIDQPRWPAYDAGATPAKMSFRVIWQATSEPVLYEDKLKHFKVEGFRAIAKAEAAVEVPSLNFSWKSDPIETSIAGFAIIGTEVNGRYYDPGL